jgi:hypothetical protein
VIKLGYVERGELTEEQLDEALDVEGMTRATGAERRPGGNSSGERSGGDS